MARPRVISLEEKFEWMRKRQAAKAAEEAVPTKQPPPKPPRVERKAMPDRFIMYRVKDVAECLGLSAGTVRKEFADCAVVYGNERSTKTKRRWRVLLISQQDLDRWIEAHRKRA